MFFVLFFSVVTGSIEAQNTNNNDSVYSYEVLAPIPGIIEKETSLPTYIPAIIQLMIGLSAITAVVMIVLGGVQYISTDAFQGKEDGKNRIKNALYGLLLIAFSFILLNEVNPKLLELNLNIEPIKIEGDDGGSLSVSGQVGVPMTQQQIDDSNRIKALLETSMPGLSVYRGPCSEGQTSGCVNLNGLKEKTIEGLRAMYQLCSTGKNGNCSVIITGGTEPGAHSIGSTHYSGDAIDIRPTSDFIRYVKNKAEYIGKDRYGERYFIEVNGKKIKLLLEHGREHYHVTFD